MSGRVTEDGLLAVAKATADASGKPLGENEERYAVYDARTGREIDLGKDAKKHSKGASPDIKKKNLDETIGAARKKNEAYVKNNGGKHKEMRDDFRLLLDGIGIERTKDGKFRAAAKAAPEPALPVLPALPVPQQGAPDKRMDVGREAGR